MGDQNTNIDVRGCFSLTNVQQCLLGCWDGLLGYAWAAGGVSSLSWLSLGLSRYFCRLNVVHQREM